jgi:polyisoprenoid-binding protein YceI
MNLFRFPTILVSATMALAACTSGDAPADDAAAAQGEETGPVQVLVPSGRYTVDPTHSILQWSISHFGTSDYHARFTDFDLTLDFDAQDVEKSAVQVAIRANGISTDYPADYLAIHSARGYGSWEEELGMSDKFMNGGEFPVITFRSTAVEKTGERTANITGDLTFRGVTKPIVLRARFIGQNERNMISGLPVIGFEAEGEILRSDFGMAADALGAAVSIYFNGELSGPSADAAAAPSVSQ